MTTVQISLLVRPLRRRTKSNDLLRIGLSRRDDYLHSRKNSALSGSRSHPVCLAQILGRHSTPWSARRFTGSPTPYLSGGSSMHPIRGGDREYDISQEPYAVKDATLSQPPSSSPYFFFVNH
jgi:hypothetical protein